MTGCWFTMRHVTLPLLSPALLSGALVVFVTSAGLFDVSHMGQLFLTGPALDEELEKLIPADVKGLKVNAQKYSLLLAENGGSGRFPGRG